MPIQTRCPSCAAAVPSTAAWCSLCHADLRPPSESTSVDVSDSTVASFAAQPEPEESGAESFESAPAGRHVAQDPPRPERAHVSAGAPGGRHAASRARSLPVPSVPRPSARRTGPTSTAVVLDGIELPAGRDVTPEQVEALADQMLTRLAVTETRPGVLDPADLPGGKWVFAAGVMTAVVLLLLALGTVVGLVVNH